MFKRIIVGGLGVASLLLVVALFLLGNYTLFKFSPVFQTWIWFEELLFEPLGFSDLNYFLAIRAEQIHFPSLSPVFAFAYVTHFVLGAIVSLLFGAISGGISKHSAFNMAAGIVGIFCALLAFFLISSYFFLGYNHRSNDIDTTPPVKDISFETFPLVTNNTNEPIILKESKQRTHVRLTVEIPEVIEENTIIDFMEFDWRFSQKGDGDYVGIFWDREPVWTMLGTVGDGIFVRAKGISVPRSPGLYELLIVLYPVGEINSEFQIKNIDGVKTKVTY